MPFFYISSLHFKRVKNDLFGRFNLNALAILIKSNI
jgi:hypothetical protein